MDEQKAVKIVICLGSSCFARGNGRNLELIEEFIARKGLGEMIDLRGSVCLGECSRGPNIQIGDEQYRGLDEGALIDLLEEKLGKLKAEQE